MSRPIHSHGTAPGKVKSVERRDVKKLKLLSATIPLKAGQVWRESEKEWTIHDAFGKIAAYPKYRDGKLQVLEVITL